MVCLFGVVLVGALAAFCSVAAGEPHLRKDLNNNLLLDGGKEQGAKTLGRTLEANKDRILKLVCYVV